MILVLALRVVIETQVTRNWTISGEILMFLITSKNINDFVRYSKVHLMTQVNRTSSEAGFLINNAEHTLMKLVEAWMLILLIPTY